MKEKLKIFIGVYILMIFLVGCTLANRGPLVWIDQPLDGSKVPLGPVIIQGHASDEKGISEFEFSVDGNLVATIDVDESSLADASYEWSPNEPGNYTIELQARNGGGSLGSIAIAHIIVGEIVIPLDDPETDPPPGFETYALITKVECGQGLAVSIDIEIANPNGITGYGVVSNWSGAEAAEVFSDPLPATITKRIELVEPNTDSVDRVHEITLIAEVDSEPSLIYAYTTEPNDRCPGHFDDSVVEMDDPDRIAPLVKANITANCRSGPDILYDVITSLKEGDTAPIVGRNVSGSWWVIDPGIGGKYCWISGSTVEVEGDVVYIEVFPDPPLPLTNTPTTTPVMITPTWTPEPFIELDLTPPVFAYAYSSPDEILTEGGGCEAYPRNTVVTVAVSDNNLVDYVIAYWYLGGESGQVILDYVDGYSYEGTVGPVNTTGTMEIYIYAYDVAGNNSTVGPIYVTVNNCIG